MRVLLISPNSSRLIVVPPPIGLATLAARLQQAGHQVELFDFMFIDEPLRHLQQRLKEFRPTLLGLSIRNIDDQDPLKPTEFLPLYREVVAVLRQCVPNVPLALGGPGFSIFAKSLMNELRADYGISGEGELAFIELLDRLSKDEKGVQSDAVQRIPSTDMSIADVSPWIDLPSYYATKSTVGVPGSIPIEISRGCPKKCIYCTTPKVQGQANRSYSPKEIVDTIEKFNKEFGFRRYYFISPAFNEPSDLAHAICDEIIGRKLKILFNTLLHPANVDEELIDKMVQAGLFLANVSSESMCDETLRALGRDYKARDCLRLIAKLRKRKLRLQNFLLLGGPGETKQTVKLSIERAIEAGGTLINVSPGLRIYPGTALHRLAIAEGLVSPDDTLLRPRFYFSPETRDWLPGYVQELVKTNEKIVV